MIRGLIYMKKIQNLNKNEGLCIGAGRCNCWCYFKKNSDLIDSVNNTPLPKEKIAIPFCLEGLESIDAVDSFDTPRVFLKKTQTKPLSIEVVGGVDMPIPLGMVENGECESKCGKHNMFMAFCL